MFRSARVPLDRTSIPLHVDHLQEESSTDEEEGLGHSWLDDTPILEMEPADSLYDDAFAEPLGGNDVMGSPGEPSFLFGC